MKEDISIVKLNFSNLYKAVITSMETLKMLIYVIIDYGSGFVTYGKITETKSSRKEPSFAAEVPLIKLIGAAYLQSPVIALVPQEHQIRMRSDERDQNPSVLNQETMPKIDVYKSSYPVRLHIYRAGRATIKVQH